ncbi:MAG: ABC transporter ATP-binding protein [Synergistaceae bacterium]|nr:ABC transporter ATP-binding protein [Synergistaceae bacterium]MBP9626790.1 ABC transporter ATP-binding protein [Synergistaceae bacterium]MBP9957687.1 ABC transporter ATP-binding protein [Synergistaceae bacterium]
MLLDVAGITVAYGGVEAVCGASLLVNEGELVSVIGANGAGKTTMLRALMGLEPVVSGSISFAGTDITALPSHLRSKLGIKIVPERARVFPRLTVYENMMMGVYGLKKAVSIEERFKKLYELFPILEERRNQMGNTLSGGEQQQLSIARACISAPKLLLVDEVSMGLMPRLVDQVFELLKQLNREEGLTILLVEQNALASLRISHRAYVLETGSIVLNGEAGELLKDERVREAYLGM